MPTLLFWQMGGGVAKAARGRVQWNGQPSAQAPVAQLDRASGYEPEGRVFESRRAHHKTGSPQEFDGTRILGCFLENHEFGPGRGHALGLQQQVVQVLVATAAAQQ